MKSPNVWKIRHISALVSMLLCFLVLSTPSFAKEVPITMPDSNFPNFDKYFQYDGDVIFIYVPISEFGQAENDAWNQLIEDYYSDDRLVIITWADGISDKYYQIKSYDISTVQISGNTIFGDNSRSFTSYLDDKKITLGSSASFSLSGYLGASNRCIGFLNDPLLTDDGGYYDGFDKLSGDIKVIRNLIGLKDDLGEHLPDTGGSDSSSSEPDIPPVPDVSFPVVGPTDNEYVPYDTTTWNQFSDRIKTAIGSSTNIGFIALAIILGILLIKKIISMFTK